MALHVEEFQSSAIDRASYDDEARTLDLWYAGGDRYRYFDVPPEAYLALKSASSAGEHVNREIKPHFRYEIEQRRRRFRPG
jgi:KTSC domain